MIPSYRGSPPPSGTGVPCYDIVTAEPGTVLDLTLLDAAILGVDAHWVTDATGEKGRSRKCGMHEGDCRYCGKAKDIWLGFIGVVNHGAQRRQILRLGPDGAKALSRLSSPATGLWGLRVTATGYNNGQGRAVHFAISQHQQVPNVPKPHDLAHSVKLALGCTTLPDFLYSAADLLGEGGAA